MSTFKYITNLLFFRLERGQLLQFNNTHLITGIIGTWIVGMGRYWDDPGAGLLQRMGMGSVIYIFVLAAFIWLLLLPFKVTAWSYKAVLTFIALTSFPAVFYAIPVERFFPVAVANTMNVWFLAIVAFWRLCLLGYFLTTYTRLSTGNIVTVTLMPVCLIISVLTLLNLHRVVFEIMGGIRNPSPHDSSYLVLMVLTGISMFLSIPLLIAYGAGICNRRKHLKNE
ncbi:hypothetical protein [Niabella aurantiaca]|uniref:hypothetical protein n=1 Tax=Niabella aurantiaca TaxID=379900 RepID=UPI000592EF21|nr:hypothetical protein [Niabella aurantiaca]